MIEMFVCTHCGEKSATNSELEYRILDTKDMCEECLTKDEVQNALNLGMKIFGLSDSAEPDTRFMRGVMEAYPTKGVAKEKLCYRVDCEDRGHGVLCLVGGNSSYKWIYFAMNDKIVAKSGKFPIKDPKDNWFYIYWNIVDDATYDRIPLFVMSYEFDGYEDERYCKYSLVFGKYGSIAETDWHDINKNFYDDWRVADVPSKFSWCGQQIDLDKYIKSK